MPPPAIIADLVERFTYNLDSYRNPAYNETQLRREFLDPFFKALGWDVNNEDGNAEAYKDVVHEDTIKIGVATKAPDYSFRIGGTRKFFVEAKKPSVNLKDDPKPAFQLRRYAWSAKLPLSILTDFEEFAVYDCRIQPNENDKSSFARTLYLPYTDYLTRWDEIEAIFSRSAILKGAFDKYAVDNKSRRGTAEVDAAFLKEIEIWREKLAKNIAIRNPELINRQLNFAVQVIIDRIIFLRICEDRGIEIYGVLQQLVNGKDIYDRLLKLFRDADDRYNSGLFHFREEKGHDNMRRDTVTPRLKIDDNVLKSMLTTLYYPCPYEFSVLPADILGQVYEQFLGKVIRLDNNHRALVEDKPEVKKAGGVYYTPTYIVDYIVEETIGKSLMSKRPIQVEKLKILDPACGSGSFLIGAYQRLLDWHQRWYEADDPANHSKGKNAKLYRGSNGVWRLTTGERKRILLANIYGVDIDQQAVEVTKLSLLLKMLEGETQQTVNATLSLFHERVLPDLDANIQCGNSLIGNDYYNSQQLTMLDEDEMLRVNTFEWKSAFPKVFSGDRPGFDAIIGNPPYVLLQDEFRDDQQLLYYREKFAVAKYKIDTYHLFIERGLQLTANGGWISMITPANFITNNNLAGLRKYILEQASIDHIVVIDGGVFDKISVDNAVFVITKGKPSKSPFRIAHATPGIDGLTFSLEILVSSSKVLSTQDALFTGSNDTVITTLWDTVWKHSVRLNSVAYVNFGKQLRDRKQYLDDVIEVASLADIPPTHRPCYTGRNVSRYSVHWQGLACLNDEVARCGGCWDYSKHTATNKLLTKQIGRHPEFGLDVRGYDCLNRPLA